MSPNELFRRAWYLLRRDRLTRELEEEMRLHVELRAAQVGNAEARQRFGNFTTVQQGSRDMWGFGRLDDLGNDVRFAFRRLAQRPAFAAAVVGVMAIGIGATTAMFSAVDAALLRPLPFDRPEQIVVLPGVDIPKGNRTAEDISRGRGYEFDDMVEMKHVFSDVAAYGAGALDLKDSENPLHLNVGVVSAGFFNMLGVNVIRGRSFSEGESNPPAPRVAVISFGLWQSNYGGRDIDSLRITLGENSYEVIGVMPASVSFPKQSDLWIPMSIPYTEETQLPFSDGFDITVLARLAPGVTTEDAASQVALRWKQLRASRLIDATKPDDHITRYMMEQGAAVGLQQKLVGDRRTALLVLLGATGLLLLVACVNVTNLLLAHSASRAREIAVRQVLGATRSRIVRQLLTESVILSLTGAIPGVMIAPLAFGALTTLLPKALIGLAPPHIDFRILAFAVSLAIATGVGFGMWPALGSAQKDSSDIIKSGGGHGSTAARGGRVRRALVGVELALTTALLIGAGLMLQSFRTLMVRETGMQTEQVATLQMTFPRSVEDGTTRALRIQQVLERLKSTPGIAAAGFVNDLPLGAQMISAFRLRVPGAPPSKSQDPEESMGRRIMVTSGYFDAMGFKLLRGRLLTETDVASRARVAVISERMAKRYWPDRDAVGNVYYETRDSTPVTVVGVIADVREHRLEYEPMMQTYVPMGVYGGGTVALVTRSSLPEAVLFTRMREAIRSVDKTQAVFDERMMNDVRDISVAPRRTNTLLINTFALLALILASVGVYAVVSYGVSHRSRELGIRSALGASGSDLMGMISRETLWVVVFGIGAGLAGAWALAKTLESLVYGIDVHDLKTFVVVPLALLIPVVIATLIPARRVLTVDPAQVMRAD